MGRPLSPRWFGGVWGAAPSRPFTVPTRQLRATLQALNINLRSGRKPNVQLLFGLARWGVIKGNLPKKSLAKFVDDFQLFEVLQRCGEIKTPGAFFLGDLPARDLLLLEKRLHHQWPLVQQVVDALIAPTLPLKAANTARRKPKWHCQKPAKSVVATMLKV